MLQIQKQSACKNWYNLLPFLCQCSIIMERDVTLLVPRLRDLAFSVDIRSQPLFFYCLLSVKIGQASLVISVPGTFYF